MMVLFSTAARAIVEPVSRKTRSTFREATRVRKSVFVAATKRMASRSLAMIGHECRRSATTKPQRAFEFACDLGLNPRCSFIHWTYFRGALKATNGRTAQRTAYLLIGSARLVQFSALKGRCYLARCTQLEPGSAILTARQATCAVESAHMQPIPPVDSASGTIFRPLSSTIPT
jgi:hypothetical protein